MAELGFPPKKWNAAPQPLFIDFETWSAGSPVTLESLTYLGRRF
jgi:hypothetical protein